MRHGGSHSQGSADQGQPGFLGARGAAPLCL